MNHSLDTNWDDFFKMLKDLLNLKTHGYLYKETQYGFQKEDKTWDLIEPKVIYQLKFKFSRFKS